VFTLAQRLGLAPPAAFLGAAVFAVHPVQVASVAWLAERKNVLCGLFTLLTMLLYLRAARSAAPRHAASTALLTFALALLSKSWVVWLPVALLALDCILLRTACRVALKRTAPMFVLAALAGAITIVAERTPLAAGLPLHLRPLAAAAAVWFYIGKLIAPFPLIAMYPQWRVSIADALWWMPMLALLLAAAIAVRWWLRQRATNAPGSLESEAGRAAPDVQSMAHAGSSRPTRRDLAAWSAAFFILALLPVLGLANFSYLKYAPVADHFLYLAIIGPALLVGITIDRRPTLPTPSRISATVALSAVLVLAGLTFAQTRLWRDRVTLFEHTVAHNPDCAAAHDILGHACTESGRFDRAVEHYARVAALRPGDPRALGNLGMALLDLQRVDDAIARLTEAVRIAPDDPAAHANLGAALATAGRLDEAERAFNAGLALDPDSVALHLNLGRLALQRSDPAAARDHFQRVLSLAPGHALAIRGLELAAPKPAQSPQPP
jgi:tetratricopeptide (TPR) repeat protein